MPKEVVLGGPRRPDPDLLAKVTGKKQIPPPQQKGRTLPPGVTGNLPLPAGKVLGAVMPSGLSKAEADALGAIGWTEDVPIPANMAEILESERLRLLASTDSVDLPIDPRTPPPKMNTRDISEVPPEDKARILSVMRQSAEDEKKRAADARRDAETHARAAAVPGMAQALNLAAAGRQSAPRGDEVEDDRPQPAQAAEPSPTGAAPTHAVCPNCSFDLSQPAAPEPPYAEKMTFLHSMLGQKTYSKDYDLFGGNVTVTFRTLTTNELDVVYRQAWHEKETGKVVTEVDYWERVNRYRLFLQLTALRSAEVGGFSHDMPDGLSPETNPDAEAHWKFDAAELAPGETPLPMIEKWLVDNVLKTEALFRVVGAACNQFNRLVANLEALADNSDFWRPTGGQS